MAEDPRPPYVRFEIRTEEDRQATIDEGHYVGKDIIFAIVTPTGTRDQVEREATAWLANIEEGVKQERIPSFWLEAYTRALENFKQSRETPEFGTPIIDWPSAAPAQIKTMLDINVRTIEELADANEETIARIGMGGRALKEKARAWLDASKSSGKVSEELNKLRIANKEMKQRDQEREAELAQLKKQVEALSKKEDA